MYDSELDSFRIWKIFACSSPNLRESSFGTRAQIIPYSDVSMFDYAASLNSPTHSFITSLILWEINFTAKDLVDISTFTSLGSLVIGPDRHERLSDRILRAWRQAVTEAGAFGHLRVFVYHGGRTETTQLCDFVKSLPSLRVISLFSSATSGVYRSISEPRLFTNIIPGISLKREAFETLDMQHMVQHLYQISVECRGYERQGASGNGEMNSLPFFTLSLGALPAGSIPSDIQHFVCSSVRNTPVHAQSLDHRPHAENNGKRKSNETSEPPGQSRRNLKIRSGKIKQADMSLFGQ